MTRLSLPILAALASTLALSTLAAHPLQVQVAALDKAYSSSSTATAVTAPPAPAVPAVSTGARPFSGLGFDVTVGLGGVGFDVATPLVQRRLNLRGGASFFSYTPSTITTDNLNINGQLKFRNAGIMVDYFPFHGRFRLSDGTQYHL